MTFTDNLKYDLHTHSNISDGELSPSDLIKYAKKCNVDVISLTDHDSIAGLEQARKLCSQYDIKFINGIELSISWLYGDIHILALNFDSTNEELINLVAAQKMQRDIRAKLISENLSKLGIYNAYEDIRETTNNEITRAHYARYLMQRGIVKSEEAAFKKFLGSNKSAYAKVNWIDLEQALKIIHNAHGISVLAHLFAYKFSNSKLTNLIKQFKTCAGDGLECPNSLQLSTQQTKLVKYLKDFDLAVSIGSDFHFSKGKIQVGKITPLFLEDARKIWHLFT